MIKGWSERLRERLTIRVGGLELLQLTLLWFTLGSVGFGLALVIEGLSTGFMPSLVTLSVLAAWVLVRTRLPNWGYGLAGTLLGLSGLTLTVGKMGGVFFGLLGSFSTAAGQWSRQRTLDFAPVAAAWQALAESFSALLARFGNWFRALQSPTQLTDPLVTSFLCGSAVWLATLWALWWVRRRASVLPGLLPAAAMLAGFVFHGGSSRGIVWLVLAGGGILLLQAAGSYRQWLQRWTRQGLDMVEIEPALVFSVILLTLGMMLAGGLLPTISLKEIGRAIDRLFDPEPGAASVTSPRPVTGVPNPATPHILGAGPSPSTEVVMFVTVEGYQPPIPIPDEYGGTIQQPVPFRWRAQVYDRYTGRGWFVNTAKVEEVAAGQPLLPDDVDALPGNFELVTQSIVRVHSEGGTVFAAGELLELDQASTVLRGGAGDVIAVQAAPDSYTAISRLPAVSVEQLRAAGEEYPATLSRYLQLPDDLPMRVRDLALSLTVDQPTAYDKAAVLEAYLRQFPYSVDVPGPPSGRDAVDYFLFDLKVGFCDYFASAMVVMARSVGLPARLVMGYSSGIYDYSQEYFVVRAMNAHAWAEVYFPGIGWVEFEPTPSQPLPYRPGQETESSQTVSLPPPGQQAPLSFYLERTGLDRLLRALLAAIPVALLLLLLPLETWWLSLLPPERVFRVIFRRLYRRGRRFGLHPDASRTADEFSRLLAASLERAAGEKKRAALAAVLASDLSRLTDLYDRLLFSKDRPGADETRQAVRAWARLRRGLGKVRD